MENAIQRPSGANIGDKCILSALDFFSDPFTGEW